MPQYGQSNQRKQDDVEHVLVPALKVGAWSGGAAGIIRSSTPGLFTLASGIQCAALGTTYYASRAAILHAWHITPSSPPSDRIYPSALAGGITGGTIGGLTRGRTNIIPGLIMFSLFGFAGQHLYNRIDARQQQQQQLSTTAYTNGNDAASTSSATQPSAVMEAPLWKRVLNSKYSPMKVLSDDEYEKMLGEKMVRVDAEIAIVDEAMEKVVQKGQQAGKGKKESD
ncbi:MAG: hypothetical protein Q9222_002020 [Ikaeria aurantiellina]